MRAPVATALTALAVAHLAVAAADAQTPPAPAQAWQGCCGLAPWAEPHPLRGKGGYSGWLFGGYYSIVAGSTVRHQIAAEQGIPEPYTRQRNPLPVTAQNAQRGAAVYEANCASCHGATGRGDGPASANLRPPPPPAELGWLAKIPASRRDAFMYWSIAEGGGRFGTAMPAYKGKLTQDEIWAVVGYIQARLPKLPPPAR